MNRIIQITSDNVSIGMEDGSIQDYALSSLNFLPSIGDEVQVYKNEEKYVIVKVEHNQTPAQPQIVINNANNNTNTNMNGFVAGNPKNKWVALALCIFAGYLGAHKFYDGKIGMGIVYLFTLGFFGIGVIIDIFGILGRPNPYYVTY